MNNVLGHILPGLLLAIPVGTLRADDAAGTYVTRPFDPNVKTLQVIADGDFEQLPVIDLEGNKRLEISFDYLADEQRLIDYTLVHCDAAWQADDLGEMDYLEYSYLPLHVESVSASFNTRLNYFHYAVDFPNDEVQPKVSGNYAMVFHIQDEPDSVLAVATFAVSEHLAFVSGTVSAITDIDFQKSHQQLTLDVSWGDSHLPHMDAASELLLTVRQNGRLDNQRQVEHPTRLDRGHAYYEHERALIFEAGNHWRRFEMTDYRTPGLRVDHVRYHAPLYYAYLDTDRSRAFDHYRYDQDQHGRYLVRALGVDDADTEAEYFVAMFALDAPVTMAGAQRIYLVGNLTSQVLDASTEMEYDPATELYHKELLLKSGAYNYQYLTPSSDPAFPAGLSTAPVEGNHYETPNEYDIYVYYRPFGARYDRLLSVAKIQ